MTNTKALEVYGPIFWEQCDEMANRVLYDKDQSERRKRDYEATWREPTSGTVMYAAAYLTLRTQLAEIQAQLEALRNCHAIQGSDGNWDVDEYMRGMFNGLELALANFEKRESAYKATRQPTQDKEG